MATNENAGWNKLTGTGWKKEGGKWVQYKNGRKTGQTRKHKFETNVLGSAVADSWRQVTSGNPTAKTGDNRSKLIAKNKNQKSNLTEKDKDDIRKENELEKVLTSSNKYKKVDAPGTKNKGKKVLQKVKDSGSNKSTPNTTTKSTVHTRHYKTGERLGVMGKSQRARYDKEAAGRTFEGEVAKYEKESGHGKSHLRETLYKRSHNKNRFRRNKNGNNKTNTNKSTTGSTKTETNKKKLSISKQQASKLLEQQKETARIMANDPRYKGPSYKKLKSSASRFK